MSNTIKAFVRTGVASVTMATTVLGLGGFALVTPALAVAPGDFGLTEGNVIKATGDIDLYIVNQLGYKRLFVNPAIFALYGHLGGFAAVKEVTPTVRDAFITSGFFRVDGDTKVYALDVTAEDTACLHWVNVSEADAKAVYPHFADMVFTINSLEKNLYCVGADYTDMDQVPVYSRGGATPGPSGLEGGAGELIAADLISSLDNEEVGEGENNVKVLGYDLEADNGSDLRLLSMKLEFVYDSGGTVDPTDELPDVAEEVTVWFGSTKVATVDTEDFNEDAGVYSKSVSLADGAVIPMDSEKQLYVAVSAVNNLDSYDLDSIWNAKVVSIRYVDAEGAIVTEDGYELDTDVPFSFVSYGDAADLELKLTKASSNPDAQVVEVDDENVTEDVLLLSGTVKATGDELTIKELSVDINTASDSVEDIAASFRLEIDGDEIQTLDSEDCPSTCVFDDVDVTFDDGDSKSVKVYADINGTDESDQGESMSADLDMDDAVVEDKNGDEVGTDVTSGTINGEDQTFYSEGIAVELTSITESKSGETPEVGTYTFKYKVTAFGTDVYIIDDSGYWGGNGSYNGGADDLTSAADDSNDGWLVNEGDTEDFTQTVAVDGDDDFVSIYLTDLYWNTDDGGGYDNDYDFDQDVFESDPLYLSDGI